MTTGQVDNSLAKIYPDVLGTITQGQRYHLDVLQTAVAARPGAIAAGKPFDVILLLQNTLDTDVDALVNLILPETDLGGKAGNLSSGSLKPVRIGLRSGEVGYVNLPVLTTHQTKPGKGYTLQIEIGVEYKQKDAPHIRDESGGTPNDSDKIGPQLIALQQLHFSIEANVAKPSGFRAAIGVAAPTKARMAVTFEVLPPAVSALTTELKPGYVSLWTAADYNAVAAPDVAEQFVDETPAAPVSATPDVASLLAALRTDKPFFTLLKFTQYAFEGAHYRLWAGECILITKLLTHVLAADNSLDTGDLAWIKRLHELVAENSPLVHEQDIDGLLTDGLYTELIHDAVMLAFPLLSQATGEDFGAADEMSEYADSVVAALAGSGDPIDLIHAYLPLTLAGLLVNDQITMQGESAVETLRLFHRALDKRSVEQTDENQFVFDMAERLLGA